MFNAKPTGNESGTFITDNDFRQIALIKNPTVPTTDSDFTNASGFAAKSLKFTLPVGTTFTADNTIEGASSGAKAYVDTYNTTTGRLYYHQTEATGFISFTGGETVNETDGSGTGTLDSSGTFGLGDIDFNSGEILYIENRAAIARSVDQTEDIKIVIQL
jgi:hypothetical protein